MLLISICLLLLLGLSLALLAGGRDKRASNRSAYAKAPADWPDVPIAALGLFRREGRINTPVVRSSLPQIPRLTSFRQAQSLVADIAARTSGPMPKITLRMADTGTPNWAEIVFDDVPVALIATGALTDVDMDPDPHYA